MPITTESGFSRPTFEEWLSDRRAAYVKQYGEFADDSVNARLAELDAEMAHSLSAHIETEAASFLPLRAKGQRLLDWGRFLIGDPKGAGTATGKVRFTGADGRDVQADQIMTLDSGIELRVVTGATVAGGIVDLPVSCVVSGTGGNAPAGSAVTLTTPILGLDSSGLVLAPGLTGGTPAETEDEYKARIVSRLRSPPQGGNDDDYISWALEVPGVTRAWVRRGARGSGEVLVLFMMDSTYPDGIPVGAGAPDYSGDVLAVYRHLLAQAPDPAVIYAKAPIPKAVPYVIHGLTPDTPEIRREIEAELRDVHVRRATPGKPWRWSWGPEAVTTAAGADSFDALDPNYTIACLIDEIAVRGAVSYV
ncbi:baseplate J/gp47 family protein [Magnetospirillum fulvum]|uniref:Baseplate J family protein n=1 Tax=Magnetospirillum fulvum MGU-K5 TaxID=1316936 RepID=S9S633_MAGFU|nr:baseplate J/gp47 family protein [Magnetospirillum fulvum]EPY01372.1 baseplate J family protein [Magnetospirillum fulvum MGU-K5]